MQLAIIASHGQQLGMARQEGREEAARMMGFESWDELTARREAEAAFAERGVMLQRELKLEIEATKDAFEALERDTASTATRVYNYDWGAFQKDDPADLFVKDQEGKLSVGPNWIAPVVDSMLVGLAGEKGMALSVKPRNPAQVRYMAAMTLILNGVLKESGWRLLQSTAIVHIACCRRAIFKVGWQKQRKMRNMTGPTVELVRPQRFWFDLRALQAQDCAFMIELCEFSEREFRCKFLPDGEPNPASQLTAEQIANMRAYELIRAHSSHALMPAGMRKHEKAIMVYAHYDLVNGVLTHLLCKQDGQVGEILAETPLGQGCPFVIATFAPNGIDARGASEAVNIVRQQRNLDYISDRVMAAASASKSALWVDGRYINKDTQVQISKVGDATVYALQIDADGPTASLQTVAMPAPELPIPSALWQLRNDVKEDIGISVAWSEMQQGRAAGFRTATEAANAAANARSRVVNKAGSFNAALEEVGMMVAKLLGDFADADTFPVQVANTGHVEHDYIEVPRTLFSLPLACEVDAYNPIASNPLVVVEMLREYLPTFQQMPDMDYRAFAEVIMSLLGVPFDFLKPKSQVEKEKTDLAAAQAQVQAGAAPGAGAAPMAPTMPGMPDMTQLAGMAMGTPMPTGGGETAAVPGNPLTALPPQVTPTA